MPKPSRPLAAAALVADLCGLTITTSIELTSAEALGLTADDLADLRSLGATDAMLAELQRLATVPGRMLTIRFGAVEVL